MELGLAGKRALVTGSTSGIGEAVARMLAEEGAAVIVHGRNADRAHRVADSITTMGGRAEIVLGDISADEGARHVASSALAAGPVDILVNNAGAYDYRSWDQAGPEDWSTSYQVNVISGVRLVKELVPAMRDRGWGRVVQIGAGLAIQPLAEQPHYNAAMAARHNLAASLARELASTGVTSNTVSPGPILVGSVQKILSVLARDHSWGESPEEIETGAARDLFPNDVGRLGRPVEVASAVCYLCSQHAGYISGSILSVDGGAIRSVH